LNFAGQINGTSGYEEAAGQGRVAGAHAALRVAGKPPPILARDDSNIGDMIDDLVTKGTDEPYRQLTRRAQHRHLPRPHNADLRLSDTAAAAGLVCPGFLAKTRSKVESIAALRQRLETTHSSDGSLAKWL